MRGHWFESNHQYQIYADVSQWLDCFLYTEEVIGSSPIVGTNLYICIA